MKILRKAVAALALVLFLSSPALAKININTAGAAELDKLPGIGPAKAKAIIDYRESAGPFQRIEDITNVRGIGKKTFEKMRDMITVGGGRAERKEPVPEAPAAAPPPEEPREAARAPREAVHHPPALSPVNCWNCKNTFYVPMTLKKGWCPFCGKTWKRR